MEELQKRVCFVTFEFDDGSKQIIKTTLNKEILLQYGAAPKDGFLYDISHAEYVKLRTDATNVIISTERPESKGVLDSFANRFI